MKLQPRRSSVQRCTLGALRHARVQWVYRAADNSNWRASADLGRWWALAGVGTHCLDLIRWAMRPSAGEIVEVKSLIGRAVYGGPNDETALLSLRFAKGVTAELAVSVLFDGPVRLELYGERVLLTHGDLLCTDDKRYMTLRATVRDPEWQRDFLAKPLDERRKIARELRAMSQTEVAAKSEEIMDVNATTVAATMRESGVRTLLHGHTHRPGIHRFDLDGRPATRIVLGAWYEHGSCVRWDESGFELEALE